MGDVPADNEGRLLRLVVSHPGHLPPASVEPPAQPTASIGKPPLNRGRQGLYLVLPRDRASKNGLSQLPHPGVALTHKPESHQSRERRRGSYRTTPSFGNAPSLHLRRGLAARNILIAGADGIGACVRGYLDSLAYPGYAFKGFVKVENKVSDGIAAREVIGSIGEIMALVQAHSVDEIIFSQRPETALLIRTLDQARSDGVDVYVVPSVSETLQNRMDILHVGELPLIVLHRADHRKSRPTLRRRLDVFVAVAGALIALPFTMLKLVWSEPVFYESHRKGT